MFHKTNPKSRIVITGCCAEKDADSFSFLPGVSNIVKNRDKSHIAKILTQDAECTTQDEPHRFLTITDFKDHTKAFVKIQDGCGNLCSYCKVPSVRGESISKPLSDIVSEVHSLVSKGFREIVLTGICLGSWGGDIKEGLTLVDVLRALDGMGGNFRIRLSSIEPKYVTRELIEYMAGNKRICRHLHIPIQSGDDEVLARMNRPYNASGLRGLVETIKRSIAGIGITTDMMVGFPGESDRSFRNSVELIKDILPVRTHIFPFSKRDGTAAASMSPEVPHDIVKRRSEGMRTAAITASYLYREQFRNKCLDILVESKRERYSGRLNGYSDNYIRVYFEGPDSLMKRIVPVKIEELNLTCTLGSALPVGDA
jgi:threonylcarbamoyladenosine tRNA methylthiotransferase MtaB